MVEKILDGQNLGVMPTGTAPAVPGFHIHATPPAVALFAKVAWRLFSPLFLRLLAEDQFQAHTHG
jgi:hypothetical protein